MCANAGNAPQTFARRRDRRLRRAAAAGLVAGLTAGLTGALSGPGVAQAAAQPSPAAQTLPGAVLAVNAESLSQERKSNDVVQATRAALLRSGASVLHAPTTINELSLRDVALAALQKNLDVRRSQVRKQIADRALDEAEALFDPVLTVSTGTTITAARRRMENPNKKYKTATEFVPVGSMDSKGVFLCDAQAAAVTRDGANGCWVITFPNRTAVQSLQYTRDRPAGYYPLGQEMVAGNDPSPYQPGRKQTYTGAAQISQLLPWGPTLNLGLTVDRRQTFYSLNSENGLPADYGSYYRPYFSGLSFNASTPLPYSKNFGPTATGDMARRVARHAIDGAELDVRTVINSTLLQVETLYWTLVGGVQRLQVAAETLTLAERQRDAIRKLYDQGLITESDKSQSESQVARIRATQQRLFGDYLVASETMHQALDSDQDGLITPTGYQGVLREPTKDIADANLIQNNPAYLRQGVAVRLAALVQEQRDAQTRPDLTLNGGMTFRQVGTFGYLDLGASLLQVVQPDAYNYTLGVLYNYPFGNRAAQAGLTAANHGLNQQQILLRKVEAATREDYESARASLASAREQLRIADRNVKLAQELYRNSQAQQELGLVAAYETLARLSSLLDARTAQVQARIDARLAESRLLASIGALAEQFGERTAQTAEDFMRLTRLRESGALDHFGGPL